jgi:hypothetical protein
VRPRGSSRVTPSIAERSPAHCVTVSVSGSSANRTPCGWIDPGMWIGSRSQSVSVAAPNGGASPSSSRDLLVLPDDEPERCARRCDGSGEVVGRDEALLQVGQEVTPAASGVCTIAIEVGGAMLCREAEPASPGGREACPQAARPPGRREHRWRLRAHRAQVSVVANGRPPSSARSSRSRRASTPRPFLMAGERSGSVARCTASVTARLDCSMPT